MSRTHLSQSIQHGLRNTLIERAVAKDAEGVKKLVAEVAQLAYEEHHKDVDFSLIKGVPAEFLLLSNCTAVPTPRTDGYSGFKNRNFEVPHYLPTTANHRGVALSKPSTSLANRIKKLQLAEKLLAKRRADLKASITVQMAGIPTVERLIARWPEVEPFAKEYIAVTSAPLPVVIPAKLNKELDLPVETESKPKARVSKVAKASMPEAAVKRIAKARGKAKRA